jgi:hypothetical protein
MIVGQSGQVPAHTRGGTDISPVRVRKSARNCVLGVIVGQRRRIAPRLTHDLRWIPYGGITQAAVNLTTLRVARALFTPGTEFTC